MERNLREELRRQEELRQSKHETDLSSLRQDLENRVSQTHQSHQSTSQELDQERQLVASLREEIARLESSLEPWRWMVSARMNGLIELGNFLRTQSLELQHLAYPTRADVPVLALEWPPHTDLDTSLSWAPIADDGVFNLLASLCAGKTRPEELEITACCVEGRWIGALHGDIEAPRLGALLAFQALRLDLLVAARCRIVPMRKPLLPKGVLELDPEHRHAAPVGTPAASRAPMWRAVIGQAPTAEDRVRSLLKGCPIEREILSALCYVRAAHPEALSRVPQPSLLNTALSAQLVQ
jgi:hypothetical protein